MLGEHWFRNSGPELLHQVNNFTTLLFEFLGRLPPPQQQNTAMLLWRNIKLWKSLETSSAAIITRGKDSLHEWMCMQRAKSQAHRPNHNTMWVKLQEGVFKV